MRSIRTISARSLRGLSGAKSNQKHGSGARSLRRPSGSRCVMCSIAGRASTGARHEDHHGGPAPGRARGMVGWLNQLQHARERTVIFVAVLEKNTDELNISTWQPQIE